MNRTIALALAAAACMLPLLTASPARASDVVDPSSKLPEQVRLDQLNNQVEQTQAQLDAANRQLALDLQKETELSKSAADLARLQYERPQLTLLAVIEAPSLSAILAEISEQRIIDHKQQVVLTQLRALEARDKAARDKTAGDLKSLQSARDEAARLASDAEARQQAELAARARAIAETASRTASPVYSGSGPWPNHFAYGYCTWYVANKRYIPWFGNAIDWWPNARPYGYAEGQAPRVGAVMVTRESSYGHVAYVEAVYPDGSWKVSEMNFTGWDQVSTRTIHPGQVPLVGFIY